MAKIDYSSDSCELSINGDVIGRLDSFDMYRGTFDAQMYEGSRNHEGMRLNLSVSIPNGMKLKLVPVDEEVPEIDLLSTVMMWGVKAFMTSMERSGTERTENGMTVLPDFICRFTPCSVPKAVHPMCAAMSETQLKYVFVKHDGSNATFLFSTCYPKYDMPLPPCPKCCAEPMLRTEERGELRHNWMQCTGCKNRTVVRNLMTQAISDWKQGDMWSEPAVGESAPISPEVPQAHGLTTPATPSAVDDCVETIQTRTGHEWVVRLSKDLLTISDEHGEILHRSRGHVRTGVYLAMLIERDRNLQAKPSAAVGADEPVAGDNPILLEYGKRYVNRVGRVTAPLVKNTIKYCDTHPFYDKTENVCYRGNGRWSIEDEDDEEDLVSEYHEPQPAESPDDWVMITDPKHIVRACDRLSSDSVNWRCPIDSVGNPIRDYPALTFCCRRKDLPVVPDNLEKTIQVVKDIAEVGILPADKPRMRQVTLREYLDSGVSYWTTALIPARRTAVVEVPE